MSWRYSSRWTMASPTLSLALLMCPWCATLLSMNPCNCVYAPLTHVCQGTQTQAHARAEASAPGPVMRVRLSV